PIKEGFKIWAIAEGGYFLNWLWHSPQHILTSSQLHLQFQASSADNTITLNPTQSVVVSLLNTLRKATYHVFLDNLFSSPNLFRVLREQGFAATGTLRLNSGVHRDLVELKTLDRKGRLLWHWNQLLRLPTADHLVMQFAWKDSKLVLMASTNYNGLELVQAIRHRPSTEDRQNRPLRAAFGDDPELIVAIPEFAVDYNNYMNSVDRGDQLRSYDSWSHRSRRGGWSAIAWGYLLEVIVINTYLLQLRGQSDLPKRLTVLKKWQSKLSTALISTEEEGTLLRVPRPQNNDSSNVQIPTEFPYSDKDEKEVQGLQSTDLYTEAMLGLVAQLN
ncbi:hypothetical protein H9Q70_009698, partial [Fusarium xylarioides]